MIDITEELLKLRDTAYGDFQAKLVPGIDRAKIIGIRVPELRRLAKQIKGTDEAEAFLQDIPHKYYDENILHSLLLNDIRPYEKCILMVDAFLPYVDNWAVCDVLRPVSFKKNKEDLLKQIEKWAASKETYRCRFGIEMLMTFFLDADYDEAQTEIVARIRSEEYYVNMMIAWYFATALAKQWDSNLPVLLEHKLAPWVHNKTIQKARESYRITDEQKEYLKKLKV